MQNWVKELRLWLGTKVTPLLLKAGAGAEAALNTFSISRISRYPVMILSYEVRSSCMYVCVRIIYAIILNGVFLV